MTNDALSTMVRNLRSEAGHSLAVSQGQNQIDTLKYLLKRTQEELWTAFFWPTLRLRTSIPLKSGQFVYPFDAAMEFEQIRQTFFAEGDADQFRPVGYGIPEDLIKGDGTNTVDGLPIEFWEADSPTMFRVWPTPDRGGVLRFVGQRKLGPLLADGDVSTLDSTVIVLFAAAELLARAKAEDADMKMQKAQRHLNKLLGNAVSAKMKVSTMGAFTARPARTAGPNFRW